MYLFQRSPLTRQQKIQVHTTISISFVKHRICTVIHAITEDMQSIFSAVTIQTGISHFSMHIHESDFRTPTHPYI